jgi:hypothetical protein
LKKDLQAAVAVVGRPGLEAAQEVDQEGLDVLAPDAGHVRGHAVSLEELGELGHALEVRRDRAGGDVRGAQVPPEGVDRGFDVPYNRGHATDPSDQILARTDVLHGPQ